MNKRNIFMTALLSAVLVLVFGSFTGVAAQTGSGDNNADHANANQADGEINNSGLQQGLPKLDQPGPDEAQVGAAPDQQGPTSAHISGGNVNVDVNRLQNSSKLVSVKRINKSLDRKLDRASDNR